MEIGVLLCYPAKKMLIVVSIDKKNVSLLLITLIHICDVVTMVLYCNVGAKGLDVVNSG